MNVIRSVLIGAIITSILVHFIFKPFGEIAYTFITITAIFFIVGCIVWVFLAAK